MLMGINLIIELRILCCLQTNQIMLNITKELKKTDH